jgi:hypothetical protein
MPSRRGHFLLLAQKKVTKEKGRGSFIREGLPAQESDQSRSAPESSLRFAPSGIRKSRSLGFVSF